MKNDIQNIELINQYLRKTLSKKEAEDFEKRLKSDESFREAYETHVILLEGLKRQSLKIEVKRAKQSYVRAKWVKFIGITVLVFVVSLLVYMVFYENKTSEPITEPTEKNDSVVISSSIPSKEVSKTDTLKPESENLKDSLIFSNDQETIELTRLNLINKAPQPFVINTNRDTTITCKEKTKLVIKANSFLDSNNITVKGPIDLKVTEYYKLSDIVLANLSTQSDGQLLETGGMLYIQAFKGNELLKLKPKPG